MRLKIFVNFGFIENGFLSDARIAEKDTVTIIAVYHFNLTGDKPRRDV